VNLFDRKTIAKARKNWKLLFLDGDRSHLIIHFLHWTLPSPARVR
jgi:hypothetical protein